MSANILVHLKKKKCLGLLQQQQQQQQQPHTNVNKIIKVFEREREILSKKKSCGPERNMKIILDEYIFLPQKKSMIFLCVCTDLSSVWFSDYFFLSPPQD